MEDLQMLGIAELMSSFCCKMFKIIIFIVIFLATVLARISWTAFFGLGFELSDFFIVSKKNQWSTDEIEAGSTWKLIELFKFI